MTVVLYTFEPNRKTRPPDFHIKRDTTFSNRRTCSLILECSWPLQACHSSSW